MKKRECILLSLMILLLLGGCAAGREKAQFDAWREQVASAGEISFTAEITGTWPDGAVTYGAQVCCAGEETSLTITWPETIAGMKVHMNGRGRSLEYDGLLLSLTGMRENALSPCDAPALLLSALREGRVLTTGEAGEYRLVTLEAPGGETVTLWRTAEDIPVSAEIGRNGAAELTLRLENWQTKE